MTLNARRHESLMTGQEIKNVFGNDVVLQLEQRLAAAEGALARNREELLASDDWEEQERLRNAAAQLRENHRTLLAALRTEKQKFSTSAGFTKTGER